MKKPINLLPPFDVNFITMSLAERKNYGHEIHNVPEAWLKTQGEGVKVSVIDTGLPIHRDLDSQIEDYANFTNDPVEDSKQGHSSHVSGIIAAKEDNEGVVGLAPKSRLLIAKALGDDGSGDDVMLGKAIDWSVEKGADIINMSLGAPAEFEKYFQHTKEAMARAYEKGVVLICASGNESAKKVGVPARFDQAIAIGAITKKKEKAYFSNTGDTLDFVGAGVNIISTFKNNSYASLSGTSMATPQLAALSALIIAEHRNSDRNHRTPINSPEDVKEHIRKICIDLGNDGFDNDYGWGLPVYGSVEEPLPPQPPKNPQFNWNAFWTWLRQILGY